MIMPSSMKSRGSETSKNKKPPSNNTSSIPKIVSFDPNKKDDVSSLGSENEQKGQEKRPRSASLGEYLPAKKTEELGHKRTKSADYV